VVGCCEHGNELNRVPQKAGHFLTGWMSVSSMELAGGQRTISGSVDGSPATWFHFSLAATFNPLR
jgi:hypothetical protein